MCVVSNCVDDSRALAANFWIYITHTHTQIYIYIYIYIFIYLSRNTWHTHNVRIYQQLHNTRGYKKLSSFNNLTEVWKRKGTNTRRQYSASYVSFSTLPAKEEYSCMTKARICAFVSMCINIFMHKWITQVNDITRLLITNNQYIKWLDKHIYDT